MRKPIFAAVLGGSLALVGLCALPAAAQEAPAKVEHIDPTSGFRGIGRAPEGVKRVSPGALLLASFDRNFDGKVSRQEISASASGVFAVADSNRDGKVSGFEQADWAASVGSQGEVLANPMMFDANLDRNVTPDEFAKGLSRLADEVMGPQNTEIAFADLVKPLSLQDQRQESGAVVTARPTGGSQISPSVVGN